MMIAMHNGASPNVAEHSEVGKKKKNTTSASSQPFKVNDRRKGDAENCNIREHGHVDERHAAALLVRTAFGKRDRSIVDAVHLL